MLSIYIKNIAIFNLEHFLPLDSSNALPAGLDINLTLTLGLNFASMLFLIGLFGIL
jgi:hypothetical protein